METATKPVQDKNRRKKMSNEDLGQFTRSTDELKKRIARGNIRLDEVLEMINAIMIPNKMKAHLQVARHTHHIKPLKYIIDGDADAIIPAAHVGEWEIVAHVKNGKLTWNKDLFGLYLDDKQKMGGNSPYGEVVYEKVKGKNFPNANILDFFIKHPHLIPNEWKGQNVHFFGTIYRNRSGNLVARELRWDKNKWVESFVMFEVCFFFPNMPTAAFRNSKAN